MRNSLRFALRWVGDVARGFIRASDARDRAREVLTRRDPMWAPADLAKDLCGFIADAHRDGGPLGVGARIACSEDELRQILIAAEDSAAPLHVSGQTAGEA